MKRILILGGGFAGVQAAIDLQKSNLFDVTLVSERDFLYLFPISIWIPVRTKKEEDVKISLHKIASKHRFKVIIDKVNAIKSTQNIVICNSQTLTYDYLVVAVGADKMTLKGIENTTTICGKPEQAVELRNKIDALIQKGGGNIAIGFGGNPKDKSAVRGGPGFELVFNIHHYLKKKGIRKNFNLTMFAPMEQPGARMGKKALQATHKMLVACGINEHFGVKISEFQKDGIVFENGNKIDSDVTMFISAGTGSGVFKNSDLPLSEAGFVKIDDNCLVNGTDNVYAVGDSAALEGPDWTAKQGHVAEIMASNTAYNIIQQEKKSSLRKGYKKHLSILCVMDMGNGAAFVYRDSNREIMIPLPVVGHWMKLAWGVYAKATKLKIIPKII